MRGVRLVATASARPADLLGPAHRLDNEQVWQVVPGADAARRALGWDPDHPWTAWGVRSRDWSALPGLPPAVDAVDLAAVAARQIPDVAAVDLMILASSTPARITRSDAHALASLLGSRAAAWDLRAGGAAGLLALHQGAAAARDGARVLVVAAEVISAYADPDDPLASLLYGDGAVALLLEPGEGRVGGGSSGHLDAVGTSFTVPDALPPRPGARFRARRPDEAYQRCLAAAWEEVADRLRDEAGTVDHLLPYAVTRSQVERLARRCGAQAVVSVLEDHGCLGCVSPLAALHVWRMAGGSGRWSMAAVGGGLAWATLHGEIG